MGSYFIKTWYLLSYGFVCRRHGVSMRLTHINLELLVLIYLMGIFIELSWILVFFLICVLASLVSTTTTRLAGTFTVWKGNRLVAAFVVVASLRRPKGRYALLAASTQRTLDQLQLPRRSGRDVVIVMPYRVCGRQCINICVATTQCATTQCAVCTGPKAGFSIAPTD